MVGDLDAGVGSVLDGLEEPVVLGVEGDGEGAVDDPPVHVHPEVDLQQTRGLAWPRAQEEEVRRGREDEEREERLTLQTSS